MEANGDQNGDLQIQNLSDDEELYHSGVDYSNKADETKPVTIKSNSQHSLTEGDQESYESSDYVVTKEKIFEKTITTTKVIRRNVPTASETETNAETEDYTSQPTTSYEYETSDGGNKSRSNDEESNVEEIKTRSIPNDNDNDNQNSSDMNKNKESINNDISGGGDNDDFNQITEIKSRGIDENVGDVNNENDGDVNNENDNDNNDNNDKSDGDTNGNNANENNGNSDIDDSNIDKGGENNTGENGSMDGSKKEDNEQKSRGIDGESSGDGNELNEDKNDELVNNDIDLTIVGNGIKNISNTNNDKNEFDCTYSYNANNGDENDLNSGENLNGEINGRKSNEKSNKPYHVVDDNEYEDDDNDNRCSPYNRMNKCEKNRMIRPRTAAAGKHLRNNIGDRSAMHNRLHTTPSDRHHRYNNYDNDGDDSKRCGMRGRRLRKLHFGDENSDDSDYDQELKKREALSARNAKKNAGIGKTRSKKIQDELDKIEAERRRVIAGDISINSTDDEKEDDDQKTNRSTAGTSTACSKNAKASRASSKASVKKKAAANKKSLKNNYRAFVSIKPSCNRYMANMWNNYVYSIHKMNILNIKKTVDNDAPKKYVHIDQKLKARQMKKEKEDEIRKNNQNILNRMIYQGKNNVGTSNLDNNNDVIEPVFRSLHADQNRRLENEMNRESMTLLKRLKEKKPYCSVEQWKKERLITEMYLRNISTYPENYPIRQKSQQKHVPPIKKNDNEELRREKSPLEQTEIIYGAKPKSNKGKRCSTTNATGTSTIRRGNRGDDSSFSKSQRKGSNEKHRSLSTANKEDYSTTRTRKPKHRTLSESTHHSVKLYADTSINQNQVDRLFAEQKNNSKLYKVPEANTTTAFDRVLNNYEKVENDIEEDVSTVKTEGNSNNNKDIINDINEVSDDISAHLQENEDKPPVEEIPVTEIEKK